MPAAQRAEIYSESPNAPEHTSNASQAQAEAKERALEREKQRRDALDSDTVAIDFPHPITARPVTTMPSKRPEAVEGARAEIPSSSGESGAERASVEAASAQESKKGPMVPYGFDNYDGQLHRVFAGTVLEGVVTNRKGRSSAGQPYLTDRTA